MKASQINHCQINRKKEQAPLLKRLKGLGFNYDAHSFGIDVLIGDKILFHGRIDEIEKWLEELEK